MKTPLPPSQAAAHTPGPWSYHFEEPAREWILVMAGGKAGQIVANVNTKSCPDSSSAPCFRVMPAEANAALIAAAPETKAQRDELLSLLKDALEDWQLQPGASLNGPAPKWVHNARQIIARAAIARVEGGQK